MKNQTFEKKIDHLLSSFGDGPFDVIAFELTNDGEGWSVNTPFKIGSRKNREETITLLRHRWEIFKVNYMPKARVRDIQDLGNGEEIQLDCGAAFADVMLSK